jgi:hypothetical protein
MKLVERTPRPFAIKTCWHTGGALGLFEKMRRTATDSQEDRPFQRLDIWKEMGLTEQ